MSQCRRQMSCLHWSVLEAHIPGAYGLEPILEMQRLFSFFTPGRAFFAALSQIGLVGIIALDDHIPLVPVKNIPHSGTVLKVGTPVAHFKLNHLLFRRIMIDRSLYLRNFLAVIPQELSTHGGDPLGQFFKPKTPQTQVGLVDALIPHIPVAIIPVPVPVVVHQIPGERPHGSRPAPQVIV